MTRLAILADIHANLPALEAVIADMQPFQVDQVIVAGDMINWGPFSVEVAERVTRLGWAVMRGNHEYYLLDYDTPRAPEHWKDYDTPRWLDKLLGGRWKNTIAAWPETLSLRYPDAPLLHVAHASPGNVWQGIYPTMPNHVVEPMLAAVNEDYIICGHTHLAMDRRVGRWRIFNPGSVGVPLDGQLSARYMILDGDANGWRPTFRRVSFDYTPIFEAFDRINVIDALGCTGRLLIEEYHSARPQMYPFLAWQQQCAPDEPRTVALAERYIREVTNQDIYMAEPYKQINIQKTSI
jgi:predicted phosphodiesterase